MEFVDEVDSKGNLTGKVMELQTAHIKDVLHPGVVVFISNQNHEVLLEKRSAEEEFDANKWALLGGHVKAHESYKDAATREIKEELGVDVSKLELISIGREEIDLEKNNSHIFHFYCWKCNLDINTFTLQKEEVTEVKWFNVDEVINLIKNKDKGIIAKESRLYLFELIKNI